MIRRVVLASTTALIVMAAGACGSDAPKASGKTVEVALTNEGCDPSELTIPSGSTTFHVKNNGADSISEFEVLDSGGKIIGEKESLTSGLEGSFTIDLKPGQYTLACPGGTKHPTGTLTVGDASAGDGHSSEAAADCVPSGSSNAAAVHLKAQLSDFKIALDQPSVAAGPISFDGTNTGTHPHEIVVVKGVPIAQLPTASNGTVDEDQLPASAVIGELEAFSPGRSCSAGFELTSGTYSLFCNTLGDEGSHFQKGMAITLTVS
jgi:hypothetical protein